MTVEEEDSKKLITVSFPVGLLDEVDEVVKRKNTKYVSRADFCRAAVRKLIEEEKLV